MKTQYTNKLAFTKKVITELQKEELLSVKGGATTFICGDCILLPTIIKNISK